MAEKKNKNSKTKLNVKQKIALAVFMESVPLLVNMWKKSDTCLTFDEWLLQIHTENKSLRR